MTAINEDLDPDDYHKSDKSWIRVGTVMSIHTQPLLSGTTIVTKEYDCRSLGVIAVKDNMIATRNNTFVIYDALSYCIQDKEFFHDLQSLKIVNVSNFETRFEAAGMSDLVVSEIDLIQRSSYIACKTSFLKKYLVKVDCMDCGMNAAAWISRYLKKDNLRLALVAAKADSKSHFWNRLSELHESELDNRNIVVPYAAVPRFNLLSYQSLTELNKTSECHLTLEQFRPDICIMPRSTIPFSEFEWEWIFVGEAVLKNIRPWDRSILDPMQMPIDMKINMMLLHCELYHTGVVQVGDDVYVRRNSEEEKDSSTTDMNISQ